MKWVLWLLALFAVAVAVTLATRYNSGYVLVVAPPYRVELSLNLLAVLLVVLFVVAYFVVRLAIITLRLPTEVGEFRLRRRRDKAREMMLDGLKAFFEGRYAKAEKASAAALDPQEPPTVNAINALIAARSAHELRKYSQRDEFIAAAENNAPKEIVLRLMTQAELLLDERRSGEALKILQSLRAKSGRQHTAALRLELKAYQGSKNWDAVLDLLRQLEQRNAFDKTLIQRLRCNAHAENLKSRILNPRALKEYWQTISSVDKKDSKLAAAAAHACIATGDCVTAHQIIEQSLDGQWDSELAGLYAECLGTDVIRQIERAETWLKSNPNDASLLLALGKLCIHCELWGKAQNYLEASLSVEPSHPAHLVLAQLNEKIGRPELAKDHYGKGLKLALKRLERLG
ncbi:heme biosynthesis HemY N-terminal domain-containing protein [Nitrosospira sp. NpAV]|uniref:heme biosynthesis HemY N-terminal domain-containing protein n=1 Tax=Nitrosospira sp. NpAV TaxID=58133 RepID=UPI0005A213EB|nr:heme biosynthesis HemY N-terminal domain-containing protein [Nitrosospira sp. NpAV]KIO48803.1 heme biosynthesis protein HemY [Nitrosospira sp. NpAV]